MYITLEFYHTPAERRVAKRVFEISDKLDDMDMLAAYITTHFASGIEDFTSYAKVVSCDNPDVIIDDRRVYCVADDRYHF